MLQKLLNNLNLENKSYFTTYNISDNFLTMEASSYFSDSEIAGKISYIQDGIKKYESYI
ncbi:MAG: hypothetical protein ACI9TV_001583 [Sulfurimonas sp.]|jgi:hypothetical protein|uniref:hypothetical protein n=1 Tax=Sulfurimonas sp. TaxID=2022749 RepID=UPI0039E446FD